MVQYRVEVDAEALRRHAAMVEVHAEHMSSRAERARGVSDVECFGKVLFPVSLYFADLQAQCVSGIAAVATALHAVATTLHAAATDYVRVDDAAAAAMVQGLRRLEAAR